MAALNQLKNGQFLSRKVIPADVRDAYARLYGVGREAQLRQAADTPRHEARRRHLEWMAEIETRIETIRAQKKGIGRPLSRLDAIALAGRWYTWFVKQHEADPGPEKRWRDLSDHFVWDVIYPHAPDTYLRDPKADGRWDWAKEPEVREVIRPQVAEEARVARFLASEGIALNNEAYARFVDAVSDNLHGAIALLQRRAAGDYTPDPTPESFPPFTQGAVARASGAGCWELFEGYVKAMRPAEGTVNRWRAVFLQMQRDFSDTGANGITEDAARSWITGLISERRAAQTVREVWLAASRTVFGWAKRHKHIQQNPFAEVRVDVPRRARNREGKTFKDEEILIILKAASAYDQPRTARERARRWVMWLCAYSSALMLSSATAEAWSPRIASAPLSFRETLPG
jgi:hypothetical protein